jgi:hypothetical protein
VISQNCDLRARLVTKDSHMSMPQNSHMGRLLGEPRWGVPMVTRVFTLALWEFKQGFEANEKRAPSWVLVFGVLFS